MREEKLTMRKHLLPLYIALVAMVSCGEEPGVRAIMFPLEPTPVLVPPAGIDASIFAALALSSGSVTADIVEDSGMVMVSGLPALPTDYAYSVMLMFAHEAREDLPGGGGGGGGGGHAHGALRQALGDEDGAVNVGMLMAGASAGEWMSVFTSADIGDEELGALRGGMIMLMPPMMGTDPPVMVLFGDVSMVTSGEEGAEEGGGGHEHGA